MNSAHFAIDGKTERIGYLPGALPYALAAVMALTCGAGTAVAQNEEEADNMRLVGHDDLQARSAYQPVIHQQDRQWIAYVGHHNGEMVNPLTGVMERNGTSIVDVTNPRQPRYLHHLPAEGDPNVPDDGGAQMAQICTGDQLPGAGDDGTVYLLRTNANFAQEIWDVTNPEAPEHVSTIIEGLDGTHKNWWECETGIGYLVVDLQGFGFATDRGLQVYDLSDPANPVFIRNFTPPEVAPGAPPSEREFSLHEPTVLGDRVYLGYGTSSDGVCQILDNDKLLEGDPEAADPFAPTEENLLFPQIGRIDMPGFMGCHTFWPLIGVEIEEFEPFEGGSPRDFAVAVNESTANQCQEFHQMVYFLDITDPAFPWPVSNYHVEEDEGMFCDRGGRFGAHSMNWSFTPVFYGKLIFVSYFNAGARAVDVRNPYHPKEAGFYIPATTANTDPRCIEVNGVEECKIAIQTNNVEVDDRGFIYLADRANTGLHVVELTGKARKIADLPSSKKDDRKDGDRKHASR
jgi:hypothetical protein